MSSRDSKLHLHQKSAVFFNFFTSKTPSQALLRQTPISSSPSKSKQRIKNKNFKKPYLTKKNIKNGVNINNYSLGPPLIKQIRKRTVYFVLLRGQGNNQSIAKCLSPKTYALQFLRSTIKAIMISVS